MHWETRSNAASMATSRGRSRSRRASSLRASTASETPLIIRSSRSTERRIERTAFLLSLSAATGASGCSAGTAPSDDNAAIKLLVILAANTLAGLHCLDELADPVDHARARR